LREITRAYQKALRKAAAQVSNQQGRHAKVLFRWLRDYYPFRLKGPVPVVVQAVVAGRAAGFKVSIRVTNGGLDANWLVRNGIPTVTLGAGQNNPHTIEEYVDLKDYLRACRYAISLASTPIS
jgi:tripeptide aminopeptidase